MPHPVYSPDPTPSDFHLFRSLQNLLNGKSFNAQEDLQTELFEYLCEKDQSFFESGIKKLLQRWQRSWNKMEPTL